MSEPTAADDGEYYSDADITALELCIEQCKAESAARRQQIESKLADEPWCEVAEFAAYCVQSKNLHLQVHEFPPCWVNADDPDSADDHCGQASARELLRKMLAAGVSKFDPDPLKALARKRKRKGSIGNALHPHDG